MNVSPIRSRLAGSHGRMYWRSLGELADTVEFREYLHREFPEQASEWNDPKGRRQFLKLMSASLALAGVGACTKQPPEQIVPYVKQPEDLVPGRPLFFASAIPFSGVAQPVLVESHMGHPTKVEGNPEHPASLGATDTFTQAAILGLYDPDRAKNATNRGEIAAWGTFLTAMQVAVMRQKARQGAGIRFLTGPTTSPSFAELMATVLATYPQAKWHQYDPISRDGARMGTVAAAGSTKDAVYHFDKADVIVALDADFLTCGPGSVRYQKDFAAAAPRDRRAQGDEPSLCDRERAVADRRKGGSSPRTEGGRYRKLRAAACRKRRRGGAGGSGSSTPDSGNADTAKWISAIAKDLQSHRGTSVVVAGEYQPDAVHDLARAMNQALGNVGRRSPTISRYPCDRRRREARCRARASDGWPARWRCW
jgi:molybdopterin-containing oxidoreductase family iron-sulfur binding subunit